jgi:hypothetical protein
MATVTCYNCRTGWDLSSAMSNRCPVCGWITEIYYEQAEAERVADIYNRQEPPLPKPSGVMPLEGINGYSVSFPDQGRLGEVAEQLLDL